ncbi:hypothetical protein D0865_02532 [Hortaea werneckii]|uniref:Uncharacterized protein n=1 Tax=Hortaea werneckii TaxID=91943 RepID=A0A3M7D2Q1_HORWE|nr:hypothetical protein D0865_02532 [Hortaea werneckii]
MNPDHPPEPKLIQGKFLYRHPLYTSASVAAQKRLDSIQGERGVSYCGAWTKYGFHEDGFSSGLRVAIEQLGAKLPFPFVDSTFSRGHRPMLEWRDYVLRVSLLVAVFWIRVVEWGIGLPGVALLVRLVEAVVHTVLDLAEFVGLL